MLYNDYVIHVCNCLHGMTAQCHSAWSYGSEAPVMVRSSHVKAQGSLVKVCTFSRSFSNAPVAVSLPRSPALQIQP